MKILNNQNILQVGQGLADCLPSPETLKEIGNNVLITVFFIVVGYLIYYYIAGTNYSKTINCKQCILNFKNSPIETKQMIQNEKFTPPINGYCFSFVLFINDFYTNVGSWRHIMHKGSTISPGLNTNYNSFNSQGTNRQYPGLWLHPNTNNIRIVVSVRQSTQNEFFDLENVPVGRWTTLSINIYEETCEIYVNGLLARTYECRSMIDYGSGDYYILYNDSASWGQIKNFRYIPNYLPAKVFAYINQTDNKLST